MSFYKYGLLSSFILLTILFPWKREERRFLEKLLSDVDDYLDKYFVITCPSFEHFIRVTKCSAIFLLILRTDRSEPLAGRRLVYKRQRRGREAPSLRSPSLGGILGASERTLGRLTV